MFTSSHLASACQQVPTSDKQDCQRQSPGDRQGLSRQSPGYGLPVSAHRRQLVDDASRQMAGQLTPGSKAVEIVGRKGGVKLKAPHASC